jgi:hypothetical protein
LCNDLKKVHLLGANHNTLYFSQEYLFNAVLGVICPFKQPLYATFTLSSEMKVSIISFLGKRPPFDILYLFRIMDPYAYFSN